VNAAYRGNLGVDQLLLNAEAAQALRYHFPES
jgi:hypothetical protein